MSAEPDARTTMTTSTCSLNKPTVSTDEPPMVAGTPSPSGVQSLNVDHVSDVIRLRLAEHLAESGVEFTEPIGSDMSFDYIGLDSLARVNLMTTLEKEFGTSLDPAAAYDFVTVGALARFVWSEVTKTPLDLKKVLEV